MSAAWQAIATVHLLDGRLDPGKPRGSSSRDLDLCLSLQIRTYSFQSPPTSHHTPFSVCLVMSAARNVGSIPKDWCLSDLVQIGLYFCLRSCEYTKTNSHRCTTIFCLRDIQFQDTRGSIPFDTSDSRFLQALVVTLFLDTQKHSVRGKYISMENTCLPFGCPIVECPRHFLHLHCHDADLNIPMCVYFEHKGAKGKSVTTSHLVAILPLWASKTGYARLGLHPHKIGSHSLRSGGAMILHQAGQYESTIKIIGNWRSDAFLVYLQVQVATFTKAVSVTMKQVMWFTSTARPPQQHPPSEHS